MSNNIQLKCTFSEEAYIPDSVVSVALQPSIVNSAKLIKSASSYRIHLQAVSYVVVDNRWAKLSSVKEFFSDSSITSNKSYCSSSLLHLKKSLTNQNFFISYVSNVVSLQLDEFFDMNGVMLQFNLYSESFCSIKSLSCSVNHCITASIVSMQTNYDDKVLIFPFQVFSYGSILKPHKAGCCNLYSIPIKAFHHSNILLDTFRNGITDIGSCNNKIFQIQDQAVICRLSFLKSFYNSDIDTYQCYPGNLFEFKFDFSCARQGCQYIRIMLIQSEYRVNDSKVQVSFPSCFHLLNIYHTIFARIRYLLLVIDVALIFRNLVQRYVYLIMLLAVVRIQSQKFHILLFLSFL